MVELKETIIVRVHALRIGEREAFKIDRGARNGTIIHIRHSSYDRSSLWFGCGDLLGCRCTFDRHTENKETHAMLDTHLPCPVLLTSCSSALGVFPPVVL